MGKSRSATILLAYLLWSSRQRPGTAPIGRTASGPHADGHPADTSEPGQTDMVSISPQPLSVIEALQLLRQGRPIAEPNEGFMDQLHMYEAMGCPTTEAELKRHKIYRRWMNKRSVEESLRVNQAPELATIVFEDEHDDGDDAPNTPDSLLPDSDPSQGRHPATRGQFPSSSSSSGSAFTSGVRARLLQQKAQHLRPVAETGVSAPDGSPSSAISPTAPSTTPTGVGQTPQQQVTIKCRKCRHTLATAPFLIDHQPPGHRDPNDRTTLCAHIFLHPLSWMREVLGAGQMEGRLSCPNVKCGTNVGKFAWTGLRCSCGGWVTPGFGITRAKVDEVIARGAGAVDRRVGDGGLRLPPGMKAVGKGNL